MAAAPWGFRSPGPSELRGLSRGTGPSESQASQAPVARPSPTLTWVSASPLISRAASAGGGEEMGRPGERAAHSAPRSPHA